ncbi:hypothetical protein BK669_00655 [Pseudomonas fluorescens]|uniref:hypothetical protein n=1 Tax=Pseudomonas monsensis TaxID=2745509 RepID=UPI000F49831C|nr:hypothetical protein [Pseudomonas monsensis]MDZ3829792.1 hypothetical protein [Pseudomonas monsensis]RON66651.1 hypothetical protein BK669_00655 [Pseudomonas fluorescens]
MNIFDESVSLAGYQLVKAFAACLSSFPEEEQIPKSAFDMWSAPLAETGASEDQMRQVGEWYALHHKTAPSLPYVLGAARKLVLNGSLPRHRLAGTIERNAMAILHAAETLGLSADGCAQAIILAGTLAHLSHYRRSLPGIDRAYQRQEIEGMARMSDYAADEILDEIASGNGDLKSLGPYLFYLDPDLYQDDA